VNTRPESIARHMWNARCKRQRYANLPDSLKPTSIHEAYAAQEEYWRLAEPEYGPPAGVKIATTTKPVDRMPAIRRCFSAPCSTCSPRSSAIALRCGR